MFYMQTLGDNFHQLCYWDSDYLVFLIYGPCTSHVSTKWTSSYIF